MKPQINNNGNSYTAFEQSMWLLCFSTILVLSGSVIGKYWSEGTSQTNKTNLVITSINTVLALLLFNQRALTFSMNMIQLYISSRFIIIFVFFIHLVLFFIGVFATQIYFSK